MRSIILNFSDTEGGAARAAYRLHQALLGSGCESRMWVNRKLSGDWTVSGPTSKVQKAFAIFRPLFSAPSLSILPSGWIKKINESNVDVVNLHWINFEMLSVLDISRIRKPIVWTLHDMWAFCGAEHYTQDSYWRSNYAQSSLMPLLPRFDLNHWTWKRKLKHWRAPMHIVCPSQWLANCVKSSFLMRDWPVTVIPNALDTEKWQPIEQSTARKLLGLPLNVPILLFGAMGGGRDVRKGFDLFLASLKHIRDKSNLQSLELVVFGQSSPQNQPQLGFPIHYLGNLHDDLSLRALYSAADVMVIPSRQDNLPNTGVESHACGTPVVAFNTCGLPDIVVHQHTGYLADPFNTYDLAAGICWVLEQRHTGRLRQNSRDRAVQLWAPKIIATDYLSVYQQAIKN